MNLVSEIPMVASELVYVLIYALDILTLFILSKINTKGLSIGVAVNMILIPFMARFEIDVFGFGGNIGNILYATVMTGMTYIYMRYGVKRAMRTVHSILVAMIGFLFINQAALVLLPFQEGNELFRQAWAEISATSFSIATASFIAFYLAQAFNVFFIDRVLSRQNMNEAVSNWGRAKQKVISNVLSQLVDSAIFFPIGFWGILSGEMILSFVFTGFLLKSSLNILDTFALPFFLKTK